MEREVHSGTLKFMMERKVGKSTLPAANNPFTMLKPIIHLHSANEAKSSSLATGVYSNVMHIDLLI